MTLCIDIGNSNIVIGGFDGDDFLFSARIATDTSKTEDDYASSLLNVLLLRNIQKDAVDACIISSVVPPLTRVLKLAVSLAFSTDSLVVGPGVKTGLSIHCDSPSSVGSDIICACVAAHTLYSCPCLIVDMGTATKISLVDKTGTFVGVSIVPGVIMGLRVLSTSTAQLPQVSLEEPKSILGKNTADSMKSGAVFGNASMIDGMIERFSEQTDEKLCVIATGGLSSTITKYCKKEITLDENLVLKGLNLIYKRNKQYL